MTRVGIIYGSTTGKTGKLAHFLAEVLQSPRVQADVRDVRDTKPQELVDYDVVLLGCSTWTGGGLQLDFIDFESEMGSLDLKGKKSAVFGPGDKLYHQHYCRAVDILEARLKNCGVEIIVESFKVEENDIAQQAQITEWARRILSHLGEGMESCRREL